MLVTIPLDQMTISDKLHALEQIWDDLQRASEEMPSPSWHATVLQKREKSLQEGSSQFSDWTEARRRIQERTR